MDNFTKGLLERNEMRNKALGITSISKNPVSPKKSVDKENKKTETNARITEMRKKSLSSPRKASTGSELLPKSTTPSKMRTVSSKNSKDDADVNVEINITSNQNIQVEVEVAECEYDENGKLVRKGETVNSLANFDNGNNTVQLRDHSRKNLKRLGVLYSDTDQISSPIQRTEENFCEAQEEGIGKRQIKKFTKLVSLASEMNNWEDDYSHHTMKNMETASPRKTGAIPKTSVSSPAKKFTGTTSTTNAGSPFKGFSGTAANGSPFKGFTGSSSGGSGSPFKGFSAGASSSNSPLKGLSARISSGSPGKTNRVSSTGGSPLKAGTSSSDSLSKPSPSSANKISVTTTSKPATGDSTASTSSGSGSEKLLWDKKVMDSLEAQGFTRRDTTGPKLIYDFKGDKPSTSAAAREERTFKPVETKKVASPAKISFAAPAPAKPATGKFVPAPKQNSRVSNMFKRDQKDPVDMSLKERMAIFEKNKGTAPMPKTPYGITDANPIRSNMPELTKKFNFGFTSQQEKPAPPAPPAPSAPFMMAQEKVPEKAAMNIKTTLSKLLHDKEMTISEKQISDEVRKQREAEMKCLLNRFSQQTETDTSSEEKGEKKRSSTEEKYAVEPSSDEICQKSANDKKRVRVSNPQRLYPVLSDIESTTETDSELDNYTTATVSESEEAPQQMDEDDQYSSDEDDANMSFGREILNSVKKNHNLAKDDYLDSTISSADVSDAIVDMDDYLNEALEDDSKNYDDKGSACSDSFQFERYPKRVSFKEAHEIPIKTKLEYSPSKSPNGSATLVHTVSFYRRQQSASNTPVKKVINKDAENKKQEVVQTQDRRESDMKIQRLLDEVMRQQAIISQTSQALNLCASTVEFSGSSEAVEGERHLLVATHRRLACLNEVQILKHEGLANRMGAAREKGSLTIQEIIVPLKQTYISRLANDEISGHHLLCLVKYNEYVLATKTLPTLPGLKSVKFTDVLTLNEVYADFKITLEIYGMTAQREVLPHDIKYHIQTPNKKRFKSKLQESNLTRPPMQSPGGPNAVRTPALIQYGHIIFSIRTIKQKSWVIEETAAAVSPLNGNVYLKIDSKITVDVNHCGFLTMFDDISGFGAWHRRWCRLSGNTLYYWKYPEDEKRKEALGQLDLTGITSEKVDVAPRSICARLHTILLESKRERRKDDAESLVLVPKGNYTTVRHLLAADTKDEREEWCLHLNKSLSLMKSWGGHHH